MYIVSVSSVSLCRAQDNAVNIICTHLENKLAIVYQSSINLWFGSTLSAGVYNDETAAQFTHKIVHVMCFPFKH